MKNYSINLNDDALFTGDLYVSRGFIFKALQAKKQGYEFRLSFTSYKNMQRAKRCYYTSLPLHMVTIDRKDNAIGYIENNVVACDDSFNKLKSMIENPSNNLTFKNVFKGFKKLKKTNPELFED